MARKRKSGPAQSGSPESGAYVGADNIRQNYIFGAVMFVIAGAMIWYYELPLNFNVTSPDFNPLTFFPLVLAGVGAIMVVRTFFSSIRAGKFGAARLSPDSARRGQHFRPVVRTEGDIDVTGDFVFVLKCIRRARSTDDFDSSPSTDKVVWKQSQTSPATDRSSGGVGASFLIPADVLPSGASKDGSANVRWVLSVSAPVRGVNFYAEFAVTVG